MKRSILRKAEIFVIAAVMSLISVFGVFAETAKEVTKESGRNIIVQDVKLPDANSKVSVLRGLQEFAPAAGVRLAGGDRVETKGNAVIYLTVDAKIVLRLDGNSEAVIEKSILGQKLSVKLKKGAMFYNVASQTAENESLELMTNNVSIAIRGTSGYLVAEKNRVTHMLFDGKIEVTDGKHTIAQKPGESFDTKMGPAGSMMENLYQDTFLLSEIPQSVVTEMLTDKALEKRILTSLPAAVDENGAPVYADEAAFEAKAKEPWTDSMAIAEVRNDPKEPDPAPAPATAPAPEPEPVPKHTCPSCGKEAEHEKRICLACKDAGKPESEYTYYACDTEKVTFHEEVGTCACGKHLVPACRKAEHEIVLEKCEICELVSYQCNLVDLTGHKEAECASCHEKYCPVREEAEHKHTDVCAFCSEKYCPNNEQEKQKHEDTHFTPECQTHRDVTACQAAKHELEWMCEYCGLRSYACEPLDPSEKEKHRLKKCESCGTEYCLGDAEESRKHALVRTCECGTKLYACSTQTEIDKHAETAYDCGETGPACKASEHALITEKCEHCEQKVCACHETKDWHTTTVNTGCGHDIYQCQPDSVDKAHEKRICEECKKAGKPESEYTYYACDHEAVAKHEAVCALCTDAAGKTVYYCSVTAEEEHVKVCEACSTGGNTVIFCPTYEKTHPLHMVYCPMENGGCGNFYCSIAESELHEIRECAACKAAGKQPSEYTYYACNGEAVAKHEATCTGGHRYCSISQSAEHVATCTSGHTYCPTSQGDAHVATCASCQTAGRAYIYCPTAEIDVPKHHAICSLADGGCGEVYCPISQISAHMNSGSNCKNKHSLKECILSDESPIFKLHFSFDKYECDCGRTILSCEALTDAHDAAYCTVCGNYHKKCLDCSGQPKSQNSSPGVSNLGSGANSLEGSPKSGENSTDGGTGSEGFSSDDADAPAPERMPYGEENIPEVAVECVAIVAAEASEKEDE